MQTILINTVLQLMYFVVFMLFIGYLIGLLNKLFYRLLNNNMKVCYATGFIGTPIHEIAHALFCIIFGHKITEISLFRISDDGVLGYVNHTYNKKNIYHRIGNYFIGVAPLFVGSIVVLLLTRWMLPSASASIMGTINTFANTTELSFSFELFKNIFEVGKNVTIAIFSSYDAGWMFALYMVIILSIALHMNLSNADLKGALSGLPFFIIILIILNLIIGIIPWNVYSVFCHYMLLAGNYLLVTLLLSLLFSIILVLIAFVISLIRRLIFRR